MIHDAAGRGTLRFTTRRGEGRYDPRRGGERDVAIHHASAEASPAALWAVIEHSAGLPLFGGGKPRLNVALSLIWGVAGTNNTTITTHRGEPRRRGLWSVQRTHIEDVPLRRGLPPPNGGRPAKLSITAQRAAGLASADEMAPRPSPHPIVDRDVPFPIRGGSPRPSPRTVVDHRPPSLRSVADRDVSRPRREVSRNPRKPPDRVVSAPWSLAALPTRSEARSAPSKTSGPQPERSEDPRSARGQVGSPLRDLASLRSTPRAV
jgi:hypothetical protein